MTINHEQPAPAKVYGDPICCPFCGSRPVVFVNGFSAMTCPELQADGVSWDMDEYQCPTCDYRSFFV